MGRELRRLLIDPQRLERADGELPLEAAEIHYLLRVLRLRPGDQVALVDGAGRLWTAGLARPVQPVERRGRAPGDQPLLARLEQPLARPLQWERPPQPSLGIAVAMPRRDGDVLLRMACELGIDRLLPLVAARSVAAEGLAGERAAAILREASEQSERLWRPQLEPTLAAAKLLANPPAGIGLLATTRQEGLPLLDQALNAMPAAAAVGPITVAIGPEGGWTGEEEKLALAAGWQPVSLGATILRVSTAAVAAATLLSRWRITYPPCSRPSP